MDPFLRLPASLEAQYWDAEDTHRQIQLGDVLGITTGALLNFVSISYVPLTATKVYLTVVVITQLVQLVWLLKRPQSYMRRRYLVSLLQRFRVTFGVSLGLALRASDNFFREFHHSWDLQAPEGRCRAFLAIVFGWGFIGCFMACNHALPFKSQAAFAVYTFIVHAIIWVQHQARAIDRHDLHDWAQGACRAMELTFWGPMLARNGNFIGHSCNGPHAQTIVAAQGFIILGCHIPLLLVYWLEYVSKAGFLKARSLDRPSPKMPWIHILLSLWAMCAVSWALLLVLHMHVDIYAVYSVPVHLMSS